MGGARHPRPYVDRPRRQVTIPWKRRVIAKLAANEKDGKRPFKIEQLKDLVDATKGSLNELFDLEREPQQLTSKYADAINEVLGIAPPLLEADDDDEEFIRDVELLRTLTPETRADLMSLARRMSKKA